jgi:hypothetical protein
MALARGKNRVPASVRKTRRLVRSNNSWPTCASSFFMPAERVGWVTKVRSAARVKLPVSTTAKKYRIKYKSIIDSIYQLHFHHQFYQ